MGAIHPARVVDTVGILRCKTGLLVAIEIVSGLALSIDDAEAPV
jgi:hypothetical protein